MSELLKISDAVFEIEQTTAALGFIQTAFSESTSSINMEEAANALYLLYLKQQKALECIHGAMMR